MRPQILLQFWNSNCGALGLPYVEVNLMSLLCNGSLLCHTTRGLTFGWKYRLALCCPYVVGQPYVWSTLCRVNLMLGQPYVGSTLCRVNLMSGQPYVGSTLCWVDLLLGWHFVSQPPALHHSPWINHHYTKTQERINSIGQVEQNLSQDSLPFIK